MPSASPLVSTPEQIIEALGGPTRVAELFKLDSYRVPSMWRHRDRIPPAYKPEIKRLLNERGFTVPDDFLLPTAKAKTR